MLFRKYGSLVIQELLATLNIAAGILVFYLGWAIFQFAPSNPIVTQGSSIFTGLGITLIFFGLGLFYTYYQDFKGDQETTNIKQTLIRIENQNRLILTHFNILPSPNEGQNETPLTSSPRISDRTAYFIPIIIVLIMACFSYIGGNLILSSGLTGAAFVLVIKPFL